MFRSIRKHKQEPRNESITPSRANPLNRLDIPTRSQDWTNIRRLLAAAMVFSLLTTLSGCSRVETGGFSDSPNKAFRLYSTQLGAYSRPYYDNTAKDVYVAVYALDGHWTRLLDKHYRFNGSDIRCEYIWRGDSNITVVVYDFGPGVSYFDVEKENRSNTTSSM